MQIEINPTWPQYELFRCESRYPAFVAGFGAGKTDGIVSWLLTKKLESPITNVAYYAPTYDLIRLIAWPRFINKLTDWRLPYTANKSDRMIYVHGYGAIIFRTMDNPENIVGFEVADSAADELDILKPRIAEKAWNNIVARNRAKKPNGGINRAAVATTPEGYRFVYKRWGKSQVEHYALIRATTYSNAHNLPSDYIDNLMMTYPAEQLAAYISGQFVNLTSGNVYSSFDRDKNSTFEEIRSREHLHVGMDFNVNHMHASIFVTRRNSQLSRGINVMLLDEIAKGRDTPGVIDTLKERYHDHSVSVLVLFFNKNCVRVPAWDW